MAQQSIANHVTPAQAAQVLETLIPTRLPVFLWGDPGIGKSQVVRQAAEKLGMQLKDVRAVLLDPVDLRGLPTVNGDGRAHWAIPDFLPTDGEGVLFLDELNAAPPLVMAACYQLILDRKLGEYVLPDGWTVVAAGNLETNRAVTSRMPTPLANRFAHFVMITDSDEWSRWAACSNLRPEVIAFLRFRPELLHVFDPTSGEKAFPTPRAWEFVNTALNANPAQNIELQVYSSIVGQAAAVEFTGFLRIFRKLPNIDAVLLNPGTAQVPDDPATLYALSGALSRKATDNNFDRIAEYADRMPSEFTVLTMSDATRRTPDLQTSAAFIRFGAKYSDVLL